MKNLNKLLGLLLFIVFFLTFSSFCKAQESKVVEVAKDMYCFVGASGYNSFFMLTDKGVVVIEPVNTAHATALKKAISELTSKPIKYLFYSHNHWDHSGGGKVFEDVGVRSYAHYEATEWMKENPHKDMRVPDKSWVGSFKKMNFGNKKMELYHYPNSHGLGMTVFYFPVEKMVYISDLITPDRVLFSIVPDFNIGGTVRAIAGIENLDFEIALFAHGRVVGNRSDVVLAREFIQDMQAAIVAEFEKGTHFTEIPSKVKLPKYAHWHMYEEWLSLNVWRIMLDMHMGPFPWRYEPGLQPAFE